MSTRPSAALREYEVLHDDRATGPARTRECLATPRGVHATARSAATSASRSRSSAAPSATSAAASTTCTCSRTRLEQQTRTRQRVPNRSGSHDQASPPPPRATSCGCRRWRSGRTRRRTLYSFAVDGKKLPLFAAVSRVKRDAEHQVAGYQRAESVAHIRTIRRYLETADAVLPNALVVAFDSRVRFEPVGHRSRRRGRRWGT